VLRVGQQLVASWGYWWNFECSSTNLAPMNLKLCRNVSDNKLKVSAVEAGS